MQEGSGTQGLLKTGLGGRTKRCFLEPGSNKQQGSGVGQRQQESEEICSALSPSLRIEQWWLLGRKQSVWEPVGLTTSESLNHLSDPPDWTYVPHHQVDKRHVSILRHQHLSLQSLSLYIPWPAFSDNSKVYTQKKHTQYNRCTSYSYIA